MLRPRGKSNYSFLIDHFCNLNQIESLEFVFQSNFTLMFFVFSYLFVFVHVMSVTILLPGGKQMSVIMQGIPICRAYSICSRSITFSE